MRVVELSAFGLDSLRLVDRPDPKVGLGQVRIKMAAFSLNYRDLLMVKGQYNPKLKFPFTPLSDGVGQVVEIGPGVTRVQVGERVACCFMQTWLAGELTDTMARSALGGALDGIAAEYVVLNQDGVVKVPDHLSNEEAATLPCAALTAWNALVAQGQLKAGDSVLIQGTGGVSLFALQIARLHGARVIATSSSDDKLARVKTMGAGDGINYKTVPDWEEKVRALTFGVGVDHIVEVGGAGTLGKSLRAVRTGGTISLIGILAGAQATVNPLPLLMKHVRLQGIFVGSREMFEAMNRAIALHQLKPVIHQVLPWTELSQALALMESGAHFGKIALRV